MKKPAKGVSLGGLGELEWLGFVEAFTIEDISFIVYQHFLNLEVPSYCEFVIGFLQFSG